MSILLKTTTTLLLIFLLSCTNLENADPIGISSFVKLYEGPLSIEAASFETTDIGFVLMGNMSLSDDEQIIVLLETDFRGNQLGEFKYFDGGTGSSIKKLNANNSINGYVIIGDSLKIDPSSEEAANIEISSARLLFLDTDLQKTRNIYIADDSPSLIKADYKGNSITVSEDGKVFILGTVKEGAQNQLVLPAKPFILALHNDFQVDWSREYTSVQRDYQNSRTLIFLDGNVIWAAAIADEQSGFIDSYVTIPFVKESSTFDNFSSFGQTSSQLFIPRDITEAYNPGIGFGLVGTFSKTTDGSKGNLFFLRARSDGSIIENSVRFFDAILSETGSSVDSLESQIIDTGESISASKDGGYILAGNITTIPGVKGNGGKDIFLIKVDPFGNVLWNKNIGGPGDESVVGVKENDNGNIVVFGSNRIGGFSSMFLMQTDKNGELTQ